MDVIAGRTLVLVVGLVMGIWLVQDMSWDNKFDRFMLKSSFVLVILGGVARIALDWIG